MAHLFLLQGQLPPVGLIFLKNTKRRPKQGFPARFAHRQREESHDQCETPLPVQLVKARNIRTDQRLFV